MDLDNDPQPEEREEGEGMQVSTGGGNESDEEDRGSEEAPAPTELARSLGHHRPALQQIRCRLYGHGSTQGMTGRLTALLTWIALQVAHTNVTDPVVSFKLADLGEGARSGEPGTATSPNANRS